MTTIGTTFSHRHLKFLGLDTSRSLQQVLSMRFSVLRLCCYWDEIQPQKNTWNFDQIDFLLSECEKYNQPVCLTIGMKAPRWPEFHLPQWVKESPDSLEDNLLTFVNTMFERMKKYECIKTWQIENEPFDKSGPENNAVSENILAKEVSLIKSHDQRPVLISVWANCLKSRNSFRTALEYGDIIGLDLYYRVPYLGLYGGPEGGLNKVKSCLTGCNKKIWITELQAEPWENKFTRVRSASINNTLMKENYIKTKSAGFDTILLWGCEFWLLENKKGNSAYLSAVDDLIRSDRS